MNNVDTVSISSITEEIRALAYQIENEIEQINSVRNNILAKAETLNSYNDQDVQGSFNVVTYIDPNTEMEQTVSKWRVWKIDHCDEIIALAGGVEKFVTEIADSIPPIINFIDNSQSIAEYIDSEIEMMQNTVGDSMDPKVFANSVLITNVARDEYSAANKEFVGIKDENIQWWTDKPLKFVKVFTEDGRVAYRIDQQDDNGNWVGMGFTDRESVNSYLHSLYKSSKRNSAVDAALLVGVSSFSGASKYGVFDQSKGKNGETIYNYQTNKYGISQIKIEDKDGYKITTKYFNDGTEIITSGSGVSTIKKADGSYQKYDSNHKLIKEKNVNGVVSEYSNDGTITTTSRSGIKTVEKSDGSYEVYDQDHKLIKGKDISGNMYVVDEDGNRTIVQNSSASTESNHLKNQEINLSNIEENSNIYNAVNNFKSDLDTADYAKVDEKMFMTVNSENIANHPCQVTHVIIKDPSQIKGASANGAYASGLETSSSAAKRLDSTLLINGSHFDYGDGSQDLKGANHVVIANGEVKTDGNAGGMEICLDNQGRLFTPIPGTSAQSLVDQGVVYTFSSHDSHFIENGQMAPDCLADNTTYNRTVIGMVEPGEYYIVTGSTSKEQVTNYLLDKNCTFAKSMDQGGSVSLVYGNQLVNNPTDEDGERAVGDFLYFTD